MTGQYEGGKMSSSLDRLKALTSKLEDKIAEKKGIKKPASVPEKTTSSPAPTPKKSTSSPAPTPKKTTKTSTPATDTAPAKQTKPAMTVLLKDENAELIRKENIDRVHVLYDDLGISEKCPDFGSLFSYKAMNLSGIGLKEEDFGVIREGKYIQIIAITYEPDASGKKKAKNISLGYFGKGETIDPHLKNRIIEFILRWRYEKAFQNVQHYRDLLAKLDRPKTLF